VSYCRWSSNNWDCDLYCYADCDGGYTTHVAWNRVVGTTPEVPPINDVAPGEWLKAHRAQMAFLKTAKHKRIGLPYDGQSFSDETLEEFLDRVTMLRDVGYHVPTWLIDDIREEMHSPESPA
jgi:hypothetical protein